MKTEYDTFRMLKRETFELTREYLSNDRWDRMYRWPVDFDIETRRRADQQADIDCLWKYGWRTGEYIKECDRRYLPF